MSEFDAAALHSPAAGCCCCRWCCFCRGPGAHRRRPAGDWARVCDPHLLRWLSVVQGPSQARRGGAWLAALALLIVILALAGPSWQKLPDTSFSARDARVMVLDLSQSMLAEDLRPNRLTRARFRLADLLRIDRRGPGWTGVLRR